MSARIGLAQVGLDYPLYHLGARSLKKAVLGAVVRGVGGRLHREQGGRTLVRALDAISLRVGSGERLGLVGGNGAGKTTLLRLLGGIYTPSRGHMQVRGRMHALLHPGQGMQQDLTGRENIHLGGLYYGLNRTELARLEVDVAEFAELGEFLDLPLRVYSAGMTVRLGFALATAIRPQILLMDEWFLTGDAAFMARARARLEALVREAEILVLATHQDTVVREWCTRALWLDGGRVRADGAPEAVLDAYRKAAAAEAVE